jgi:hypothetical protein
MCGVFCIVACGRQCQNILKDPKLSSVGNVLLVQPTAIGTLYQDRGTFVLSIEGIFYTHHVRLVLKCVFICDARRCLLGSSLLVTRIYLAPQR